LKILDLGCGPIRKKPGSVGLDKRPAPHVDVVHDLNVLPYPFSDSEFDMVEMSHIIEHVERPLDVLNEVYRITKGGGEIRIITPHFSSYLSYGDLEHFHHFGFVTFKNLENTGLFRIARKKIWFTDVYKVLGISILANSFPRRWEKYFSFIFPALYVEVLLQVIKRDGKDVATSYIYL
jgi:ubiquinone/menaquinone biosynthesis C-methylase UbiE